jgi:hypothetical protein
VTAGQRIAIDRLTDKIQTMRMLRGARVVPLVTLSKVTMKTKFGPKPRPEFEIIGWRDMDNYSKPPAELATSEIISDDLPF